MNDSIGYNALIEAAKQLVDSGIISEQKFNEMNYRYKKLFLAPQGAPAI